LPKQQQQLHRLGKAVAATTTAGAAALAAEEKIKRHATDQVSHQIPQGYEIGEPTSDAKKS
jgi:hypothetical protein